MTLEQREAIISRHDYLAIQYNETGDDSLLGLIASYETIILAGRTPHCDCEDDDCLICLR